jgi:hypothetical protein
MTFGRKGLAPGTPVGGGVDALRNGARTTQPVPPGDDLARKREAFLAAERERRAQLEESGEFEAEPRYERGAIRPERSLAMAYVLWFLFGQFSVHRFYLGRLQSAMIQFGLAAFSWMLILGGIGGGSGSLGLAGVAVLVVWGLWVLGDVFFIHSIHRKHCRQPGELASAFA